jgi:hypothetical protein
MKRVKTGCDTCVFAMPDSENNILVCAGRSDIYGKEIPNIKDGCPDYEMSFSEFCRLHAKYDKYTGEYVGCEKGGMKNGRA